MVLCQNGDGVPLYYMIVGRTGSRYPIVAERGMNMHIEVEQKFRAEHSTGLLAQLERLVRGIRGAHRASRSVFCSPGPRFCPDRRVLRIRRVGERNFVTYKGPKLDATTKTRRELELPLTDGAAAAEQFAELLTALGFSGVREVRKSRQAAKVQWRGQEIEIALRRCRPARAVCRIGDRNGFRRLRCGPRIGCFAGRGTRLENGRTTQLSGIAAGGAGSELRNEDRLLHVAGPRVRHNRYIRCIVARRMPASRFPVPPCAIAC